MLRASMSRRSLLAASTAPALALASRAASKRPNVVFFMTDDHGAWALGSGGCRQMHTPNIDRLAEEGTRFTQAFACTPVCSPSRMTYMTGALPCRHGVQDWLVPRDSFGPESRRWLSGFTTWSEVLAANGYTLGMCGKWHMGEDDRAQAGFSYWATIPGGGGPYRDPEFVVNGERRKMQGFKTDCVAGFALDFLGQVKNRPFCLFVPFYAPHTPFDYQPEEYRKPYENFAFSCFPRTPTHPWANPGTTRHHGDVESMRGYSALVTGVAANVGRILRKLDEMGVRENTTVIFTADQGFNCGHHGVWGKGNGTIPFNMYEESIRVPLIWNHPGRIPRGRTVEAMVSSYDFFPTILDYLGLKAAPDERRVGRSYAPFLAGRNPAWRSRLYFEYAYVRAVRTRNLKYVQRSSQWPSELFDLEADPGETRNVIHDAGQQAQVRALARELDEFFRRNGAVPVDEWRSAVRQHMTVYKR